MSEREPTSTKQADRQNILDMRQYTADVDPEMSDENFTKYITRPYGAIRREGLSPQEAREFMYNLEPQTMDEKTRIGVERDAIDKQRADEREQKQIAIARARKMIEMGGYKEELDDPEGYFYHGTAADPDSIKEKGLLPSVSPNGTVPGIDWWNGTQEMHQNPRPEIFYSYMNDRTNMYRVRKDALESLGFELVPFSEGNPATHAYTDKTVVPPEALEMLDKKLKLWVPVIDKQPAVVER